MRLASVTAREGLERRGEPGTDDGSHPRCVVCSPRDALGLGPKFVYRTDGSVESRFECSPVFEGYPQQIHGGVIALLLDGAMTNCLFAHGQAAVTAELKIRYRIPVVTSRPASIRARIARSDPRLRIVEAELVQDGRAKAMATAKFVDRPSGAGESVGSPAGRRDE